MGIPVPPPPTHTHTLSTSVKLGWSSMISCFQRINGIIQNTITPERTLRYVKAGQAFIKRGGSIESHHPSRPVFLTFCFKSHLRGQIFTGIGGKQKVSGE